MEVVDEVTDAMKKIWKSQNDEPFKHFKNSMEVASDFIEMVSIYGKERCVGKPALSDKRFKVTRNGSYYELADYGFTFDHMGGITMVNFDYDCMTNVGRTLKKDALYVEYLLANGFEGKITRVW